MKAALTISRPSFGDGKKKIKMTIEDVVSRVRFVDLEIDLDKFSECITGLSSVECDIVVRNLANVGKIKESESLEFKIPEAPYMMDKKDIYKLAELSTPDGWTCSGQFGSKSSFFTKDGVNFARTNVFRWV